jgi:short-subunit dehydrogenase
MHIFITGGTKGIGKGLVIEFLKKGHEVSFTGTSIESISLAEKDFSGTFSGYVCDVRDFNSIVKAKDEAVEKYNCIDIWINNAGVDQERGVVSDLSPEGIKRVIDINVTGMINGTSVALKEMRGQNFGVVYNMEGLGSNNMMIPKTLIYSSSKRLLRYFSRACNKELKQYKEIFVGTLSPGMVFTNLLLNDSDKESLKISSILGNKVDEVTPFLVDKMLKGKKKINWLTNRKIMWKFTKSLFVKNDITSIMDMKQ